MDATTLGFLAAAGEATLLTALMRVGLLEKLEGAQDIHMLSFRGDPEHVAVVALGDNPVRLIFDADFGWLWYNADGTDDDGESHAHDPA